MGVPLVSRFGFGPKFIHGIKLLYNAPRTRVCTNNWLSTPFNLFCGTQQGCPLSPSLFALALEPLAILIRSTPDVMGLRLGKLEERLSLYANDALLYLNDAGPSLLATLLIFDKFGAFSGIRIYWSKSVLFPIDADAVKTAASSPLRWIEKFRYLGVIVTQHLSDYMDKNLLPLLTSLKAKCNSWAHLPLNLLGRKNLLKMIFLPKFNFFFKELSNMGPSFLF